MASTFIDNAQRSASRGSIDLPLAAVAALAVAFVAFVMPADLLARIVEASRLPEIFAAAQPPLGMKARAAVVIVAAVATFAAVFLLLRSLGRPARPAKPEIEEVETEWMAPRLRRSDVHPDAPARRPILAARELGEPTPEPRRDARSPAAAEPQTEPEPEPAAAPFWHPDDFPQEVEASAEQVDEPEGELDLDDPEIERLEAAPAAPADESSIPDLIARLERGLERRLQHRRGLAEPHRTEVRSATPARGDPAGDDRLRSAIENLQKMASRA